MSWFKSSDDAVIGRFKLALLRTYRLKFKIYQSELNLLTITIFLKKYIHYSIRPLQPTEFSFLKEMFYTALHVPEGAAPFPKSIIDEPNLAKYIANWGREDDIALVAEKEDILVGAVWCRLLKSYEKGYGYIDDQTPELSLAIQEGYRNQGVGNQLMKKAFLALSKKGFTQVSLSVDQDNKAVNLYKRLDFEIVEVLETAFTMKKVLKY